MRRALPFLALLIIGVSAQSAAAAPTAVTKRLPQLPATGRDFSGIITGNGLLAWAAVGPRSHPTYRVWRLRGKQWHVVVRRATTQPFLRHSKVVVACPFVSGDGGRTFHRAPQHAAAYCNPRVSPPADVKTAGGYGFRAPDDLNAMLVRAPGASVWTASAPAFAWTDNNGFGEAVSHFEVFGAPLRLVLFRGRFGSRGSRADTPFWSTDLGATWHEGAAAPGNTYSSDLFGGGRIYTAFGAVDEAAGSIPAALSFSSDLGATWQTLSLPGGAQDFDLDLQHGPVTGSLAVIGTHIWVTDDGGASAATLASVPPTRHVDTSTLRYGDWLIVGGRTISRVTLTG